MTILHATTDPDLLTRLKEMLGSAARADIAVGYFFISGFSEVSEELIRLKKTRILVGRTDRPTLEAVAAGLHQTRPIQAHLGRYSHHSQASTTASSRRGPNGHLRQRGRHVPDR